MNRRFGALCFVVVWFVVLSCGLVEMRLVWFTWVKEIEDNWGNNSELG